MNNPNQVARMLEVVASCEDPGKLRQIATNAAKAGANDLRRAAVLKLYSVLPSERPGTFEYDVWHSIYALEGSLSEERGKTTRLARTRQKIGRDGEKKTVADLILGSQSAGFDMLIDRDMPELTFEALAIKHAARFTPAVVQAAGARLSAAGVDPSRFE